jgi:RND superfamily putative drug exporter
VTQVQPPQLLPARDGGQVALVTVFPATAPQDAATTALLAHLRSSTVPQAVGGSGLAVYIGGATATYADFAQVVAGKLALFIVVIVGLSFLVLALVFRSLLIPLTAAAMNLLSISAAFGIVVAAFQWNWLGPLLGAGRAGPVESFLPVMLFAVLFGLSMDYQVFLLTRTHELLARTGDNRAAVRGGIAGTGRVITSAAAIMVVVFGSFVFGDNRVTKEFGLGLAGGVLVDAMIIRTALVPALMLLFGRANWWFPRSLGRRLPRVGVEPAVPVSAPSAAQPGQPAQPIQPIQPVQAG